MVLNNGLSLLFIFALLLLSNHAALNLAQRSTYIVHMDKSHMPKVYLTHHQWYSAAVNSVDSKSHRSPPSILYSYDNALHGFSAILTKDELESIKQSPGFVSAYKDMSPILDTTHTSDFLSLNPASGLLPAADYGRDVIVGVLDSGVWPESASFRDFGQSRVPARWKGECEVGQHFNASLCNSKLIGARSFNKGLLAANPGINISMNSARDTDGHGTHVSSTVTGNYVEDASYFGYAMGIARGVAPRAMVAVYKLDHISTRGNYNCSNASSDLNYPSFIVFYTNEMSSVVVQNFSRIVTNVGNEGMTYTVKVTTPEGSVVTVTPKKLVFEKMYEKQRYSLSIRYKNDDNARTTSGSIVWTDMSGKYTVRSPIVVAPDVSMIG